MVTRPGFLSFILCIQIILAPVAQAGLDWDPDKRVPIRERILNCETLLAPAEPHVDDGVGIVVSSNHVDEFRESLSAGIEESGLDRFHGGHYFVMGTPMANEVFTREAFEGVLEELGVRDARVRVLSVPLEKVQLTAQSITRVLLERFIYWFPSIKRDYERPVLNEVISGLVLTASLEFFNGIYLFKTLPALDFGVVIAIHALIYLPTIIYKKAMSNWLLRGGISRLSMFLRQVMLSVFFVLNYHLSGNLTELIEWSQADGPAEFNEFMEITGLGVMPAVTAFLQTGWYHLGMNLGIRSWERSKEGLIDYEDARTAGNIISWPFLAFNAVLLAMASEADLPLWVEAGPIKLNQGHVGIIGLTLLGSTVIKWPKLLDPPLRWYQGFKHQVGRVWNKIKPKRQEDRLLPPR